jgi:hypothetical protein
MKLKPTQLLAVALLGPLPAFCQAQNFSADVVYAATSTSSAPSAAKAAPPQPSKLYVSKDKMRLETRGVTGTVLLVNLEENTAVALFPADKAYQPLNAAPSEYFRVHNAEEACPDWQKAAEAKIVCDKVGHATVDGRETVKYVNKSASTDGAPSAVWIDPTLNFVVKWEASNAGAELRNIKKEEPQSADLFVIPQDYDILRSRRVRR